MPSDLMLIEMLSETHRPFIMVLTKADKPKEKDLEKRKNEIAELMKHKGSLCSPIIHLVSAQ